MNSPTERRAFQDYYPDATKHCYGCGSRNPDGYRFRSFAEGDEAVCRFTPEPRHTAVPGAVYGGLIASLVDCHGTGTAAWEAYRAAGRPMDSDPPLRFVTGSLRVDYRKPTPLGVELVLRARAVEVAERKVRVRVRVEAEGVVTAEGEVVAVRIPEGWLEKLSGASAGPPAATKEKKSLEEHMNDLERRGALLRPAKPGPFRVVPIAHRPGALKRFLAERG